MNSFAQKEGLPGMGYIFWREGRGWFGAWRPPGRWPRTSDPRPDRGDPASSWVWVMGDAAFFLGGKPEALLQPVAGRARNEIGR